MPWTDVNSAFGFGTVLTSAQMQALRGNIVFITEYTTVDTSTYVFPGGHTHLRAIIIGGGGGGGAGAPSPGGGAGGSPSTIKDVIFPVSSGETIYIHVGAGGLGGVAPSGNGGAGTASYIATNSSYFNVSGGAGGLSSANSGSYSQGGATPWPNETNVASYGANAVNYGGGGGGGLPSETDGGDGSQGIVILMLP